MRSGWPPATAATTAIVCVSIAFASLFAARARADAELDLMWGAPAECPDANWATQRVASHLGRDLAKDARATLHADAQIVSDPESYHLTLRTLRGNDAGERLLTDARCDDLAEAAALMIA